jgi:hypothetical protein
MRARMPIELVSLLATALVWLGGWLLATKSERTPPRVQIALVASGALALVLSIGVYRVNAVSALVVSLLLAALVAWPHAKRGLHKLRDSKTFEQNG